MKRFGEIKVLVFLLSERGKAKSSLGKLRLDGAGERDNSLPVCCMQSFELVDEIGSLRDLLSRCSETMILKYGHSNLDLLRRLMSTECRLTFNCYRVASYLAIN